MARALAWQFRQFLPYIKTCGYNKLLTAKVLTDINFLIISLIKRPKLWKMDMRFGTWNVRSLYRAGSLMTVASEI
jgi:hypothetical protein